MSTITTKDIEYIINTWQEEVAKAEKDPAYVVEYAQISEEIALPLPTVKRVLNGYKALKEKNVEYLDKHPRDREIFQAIVRLFSMDEPAPKKRGPKPKQKPAAVPEPEPKKEEPQRDILEEIWKKRDYYKTRYWVLNELLEELLRGQ